MGLYSISYISFLHICRLNWCIVHLEQVTLEGKILQFNFYSIVFEIWNTILIPLRLQFHLTSFNKTKTPKKPTHCRLLFVARLFSRISLQPARIGAANSCADLLNMPLCSGKCWKLARFYDYHRLNVDLLMV